jgi:hypothetical protein
LYAASHWESISSIKRKMTDLYHLPLIHRLDIDKKYNYVAKAAVATTQ